MEIRVCLVDAVIALAAIGSDKREALRGNMLKHVDLRVRIRLVKTKQRPLQFESPTLFSSPTQSAISQKSFEILENRGKFALFSLVLRASARRTREASVYTELVRRPQCLHRLETTWSLCVPSALGGVPTERGPAGFGGGPRPQRLGARGSA